MHPHTLLMQHSAPDDKGFFAAAQPVYERAETVSLGHVVKLVPLAGAKAPGDGQKGG